jgi:predicted CoA-substrate-specific enzyme activase
MITLGIDIGSTTSKCVLMRDGQEIIASSLRVGGLGTEGPDEALSELWKKSGISAGDVDRAIVTGYGRNKYEGADGEVSELTCHALGGRWVFPELRTLIDIGGQDAKIISLSESGRMSNFVMNDKCAAGTGKFIEVMANRLGLTIEELFELAEIGNPISISSLCTVFAESEVINYMGEGRSREDLAAGVIDSVALKVATLVQRKEIQDTVIITGGFSNNEFFASLLSKKLGKTVTAMPLGRYAGAYGAALLAKAKDK